MFSRFKENKASFVILALLLSLGSCGKSPSSKKNTSRSIDRGVIGPTQPNIGPVVITNGGNINVEGKFQAELTLLNPMISAGVSGKAELSIDGDQFFTEIQMSGLEAYSAHAQYIHDVAVCPDMNHDANGDGYLDAKETQEIYGKVLIPLDGDISSQFLDLNVFPSADGKGNYLYQQTTDLNSLISDLRAPDLDLEDAYKKLDVDENLNIEGRSIVIYGVSKEIFLPSSVRSFYGFRKNISLPLACGTFKRVSQ